MKCHKQISNVHLRTLNPKPHGPPGMQDCGGLRALDLYLVATEFENPTNGKLSLKRICKQLSNPLTQPRRRVENTEKCLIPSFVQGKSPQAARFHIKPKRFQNAANPDAPE